MDFRLDQPGETLFVRALSDEGIQVGQNWYRGSLILSTGEVISPWDVSQLEDLNDQALEAVFALNPEVVLVGTGVKQQLLPPELMMKFYQRGVGVEAMTTAAACRTFNVLVGEHRRVVAALVSYADASTG